MTTNSSLTCHAACIGILACALADAGFSAVAAATTTEPGGAMAFAGPRSIRDFGVAPTNSPAANKEAL